MAEMWQRDYDVKAERYVAQIKEAATATEAMTESWKNYYANQGMMADEALRAEEQISEESEKIHKASLEKHKELQKAKLESYSALFASLGGLFSQFGAAIAAMDEAGGTRDRSSFNRQKNLRYGEAVMATAAAVTKGYGEGGWQGIIMGTLAGLLGAVQIATIKKQEYAYAKGGVFTNSVVDSPTPFNNSIMGEAGPEAIMPLAKGPGGELGVKSIGGNEPTTINYIIHAIDSKSFVDTVRKNPEAITLVMNEQMQRGNSALNNNIRRVAQ
jgi:hypothetical protein